MINVLHLTYLNQISSVFQLFLSLITTGVLAWALLTFWIWSCFTWGWGPYLMECFIVSLAPTHQTETSRSLLQLWQSKVSENCPLARTTGLRDHYPELLKNCRLGPQSMSCAILFIEQCGWEYASHPQAARLDLKCSPVLSLTSCILQKSLSVWQLHQISFIPVNIMVSLLHPVSYNSNESVPSVVECINLKNL